MIKYSLLLLNILLFTIAFGQISLEEESSPDTSTFVPNEFIVKFKEGTSQARRSSIRNESAVKKEKSFKYINSELWLVNDDVTRGQFLDTYSKRSEIEFIEPNYIYRSTAIPDDPLFNNLWGLHNTISSAGQIDADIDAVEAWDIFQGNGTKPVAITDTGVDYFHPDLNQQLWQNLAEDADGDGSVLELNGNGVYIFDPGDKNGIDDDGNGYVDDFIGWDFVNNDNEPRDFSNNGHGTHVAGTVGASINNQEGIVGANPNSKLVAIKYLNDRGGGSTSTLIQIVEYIVDMGIPISNNSFGGGSYSQALFDMLEYAQSQGHIFVASAGNRGQDNDGQLYYPASYDLDNIVSVAANGRKEQLASFSSYGQTTVDLSAPGVNILSCERIYHRYTMKNGTSMSAPHVAGALSLAWEFAPQESYQSLINTMLGTVDVSAAYQNKCVSNGRLNMNNMLRALSDNGCRELDSLNLVAFRQQANGSNWINTWNLNQPIQTWHGVSVNADGCVIALNLSNNNLSGSITNELGRLANLTSLNLNNNNVQGSIPAELGDLSNLTTLRLDNNNLSGPIPANLGNLFQAIEIRLNNNQLSGIIPNLLAGLESVETLLMQNNQLSGSIPSGISDLNSLAIFSVQNNNMSGCYSPALSAVCGFIGSSNTPISSGNNFDQSWSSFCQVGGGECLENNCRSIDSLALIALFDATDGCSWKYTWDIYSPMENWYGVELNGSGCVTSVDLSSNNLIGTIPPEIGNLTSIENLSLMSNILFGGIPNEIGNLNSLVELRLSRNTLEGNLPSSIGNLINLEILWLNNNRLNGPIPNSFQNFTALRELYMQNNKFTGGIPSSFGNFASIEDLFLNSNLLDGTIPSSLGNATALKRFHAYNNFLTGTIPPSLGNLTNLIWLNLSQNQLTGSIPSSFGNLNSLLSMSLSSNYLTGPIPASLGNLSNLQDLYLFSNQLSGSIPGSLGDLQNLGRLYLFNNNLSGCYDPNLKNLCGELYSPISVSSGNNLDAEFPDFCSLDAGLCGQPLSCRAQDSLHLVTLYQATNGGSWNNSWNLNLPMTSWFGVTLSGSGCIDHLKLNNNNLTGALPEALGELSSLKSLELFNNNLSSTIPVSLGNLIDLEVLKLSSNNLTGSIPSSIGNLTSVHTLFLSSNNLSGSIPSSIGDLVSLKVLYVQGNSFTGTLPSNMANLPVIEELRANSNNLSGSIPSAIGSLTTLKKLALFNNSLTGAIPSFLSNLTQLVELNLSQNNLSGSIPSSLSNLNALIDLALTSNQFTGTIPSSFGSMASLQRLFLSGNNLSGEIPAELGNLSLVNLYLFNNNLSGCYDSNLQNLCNSLAHTNSISEGNNFNATWASFCLNGNGTCGQSLACNSRDSLAMVSIYNAVGGGSSLNWDFSEPIDTWNYVVTNNNGCVTRLSLSNLGLSGQLPPEIGEMKDLQQLWLTNNNLSGQLPPQIGDLSSLQLLFLHYNNLSGTIPYSLNNLTLLKEINLSNNNYSGSITNSFEFLASIEKIYLSHNSFSGSIPSYFANLLNLKIFSVAHNSLTGSIPIGFGSLDHFRDLNVEHNSLTGSIPGDIGNSSSLYVLRLNDNNLTGTIPANMGSFGFLFFYLQNNNLSGCYPDELSNWCGNYYDFQISFGNEFDEAWSEYCSAGLGGCSQPVWPGDLDNDGIVKNLDVLSWGLSNGSAGSSRINQGTTWQAYGAIDWDQSISQTNCKFQDADGNGVINMSDLQVITTNFNEEHIGTNDVINMNFNHDVLLRLVPVLKQNLSGYVRLHYDLSLESNASDLSSHGVSCSFVIKDLNILNANIQSSSSTYGVTESRAFLNSAKTKLDVAVTKKDQVNELAGGPILRLTIDIANSDFPIGESFNIEIQDAHWSIAGHGIERIVGSSSFDFFESFSSNDLRVTTSVVHASCQGEGSIQSWVTGGQDPYSYHWNTGETSSSISLLSPATYELTVSDQQASEVMYNMEVNGNFIEVLNDVGDMVSCYESVCPTIMEFGQVNIPNGIHSADAAIYANGQVLSTSASTFKAENLVLLEAEFEVIQGASFEVIMEACE